MNAIRNQAGTIRRANATDAQALAGIMREPMLELHGDNAATGRRATDFSALEELGDPQVDTLVADASEGLQGFLQLRWGKRPPSAGWMLGSVELRRHHVRVRHRGAGVALRLLDGALGLARERSAVCVWLKVEKTAPQAIGFYRKHGFRIAGTSCFADGGQSREHWVMHRVITPVQQAHRRAG
ncbi:MAG TPA: GNAT family N-acetyltransferase [Thermomonas sp.]|nr:GNAT family N-acetyltransferase [Thermomonas sp.]